MWPVCREGREDCEYGKGARKVESKSGSGGKRHKEDAKTSTRGMARSWTTTRE